MGDRVASPFVHQADVRGDQHGALMPGVEVLANALNTILRSRFYAPTPDWLAFLFAALAAAAILGLLAVAQGRHEMFKQMGALAGRAAGILLAGYCAVHALSHLSAADAGAGFFASAGILGLLRKLAQHQRPAGFDHRGDDRRAAGSSHDSGSAPGAAETIAA